MITIPLTIQDNFFDNPNIIKDWGLSLDYKSNPLGSWPGKRTQELYSTHSYLYRYICNKVLSLFFENVYNLEYEISLQFQLIENLKGEGWIHQDPNLFTFIIYLSNPNPKIDCGTSIWSLNSNLFSPINNLQDKENNDKQLLHHQNETLEEDAQYSIRKNFTKEISIPDKYNRLIAFSSEHFHSANFYDNKISPRLTLIGFVNNINRAQLPIVRSKQIMIF